MEKGQTLEIPSSATQELRDHILSVEDEEESIAFLILETLLQVKHIHFPLFLKLASIKYKYSSRPNWI